MYPVLWPKTRSPILFRKSSGVIFISASVAVSILETKEEEEVAPRKLKPRLDRSEERSDSKTHLDRNPSNLRDEGRGAVDNWETSFSTEDSDLSCSERADHGVLDRRGKKRRSASRLLEFFPFR